MQLRCCGSMEHLHPSCFCGAGEGPSEQQMPEWSKAGPAPDGVKVVAVVWQEWQQCHLSPAFLPHHVSAGGSGADGQAGHVLSLKVLEVKLDVNLSKSGVVDQTWSSRKFPCCPCQDFMYWMTLEISSNPNQFMILCCT